MQRELWLYNIKINHMIPQVKHIKAGFVLKMYFSICPGLVTDAAMGGEKGNVKVGVRYDCCKPSILSEPHYRPSPNPANQANADHQVLPGYMLSPWVHCKGSKIPSHSLFHIVMELNHYNKYQNRWICLKPVTADSSFHF